MNIREAAIHCECRKIAYRQSKDGIVLSLLLHPQEVPDALATAALGARYMVAFVELGDDEQPVQRVKESNKAVDPVERIISDALDAAGVPYDTDSGADLDFHVLDGSDVFIEVKQFHSPRIAEQMARASEVIAVQGRKAATWLAKQITRDIGKRESALPARKGESDKVAGSPSRTRRMWSELSPAQQAGLLCGDPLFQRFLYEGSHTTKPDKDEAAAAVREICGVTSRSEIGDSHTALVAWRNLVADFRNFERALV